MVLPLTSVARIVTATGTPATCGDAIPETTKWSTALGCTAIAGEVMPWMPVFETSLTVSVCEPTVLSVTFSCTVPPASVPFTGVLAAASLEVMRTLSALPTRFHQLSVALTVTANACPALCDAGEPDLPLVLPGVLVSPGARSCRRESPAGDVTNGSLVPFLPGAAAIHA